MARRSPARGSGAAHRAYGTGRRPSMKVWRTPCFGVYSLSVTTPTHDLSRLRIDRDPPPAVRRAFGRTAGFAAAAVIIGGGFLLYSRNRSAATVETVVAAPLTSGGSSAGGGGATSVTA